MYQGGVISGIGEDASSGGVGARRVRLGATVYTRLNLHLFRWGDFRYDEATGSAAGCGRRVRCGTDGSRSRGSKNAQTLIK